MCKRWKRTEKGFSFSLRQYLVLYLLFGYIEYSLTGKLKRTHNIVAFRRVAYEEERKIRFRRRWCRLFWWMVFACIVLLHVPFTCSLMLSVCLARVQQNCNYIECSRRYFSFATFFVRSSPFVSSFFFVLDFSVCPKIRFLFYHQFAMEFHSIRYFCALISFSHGHKNEIELE